ncbi:MAG: sigma-70 family RNA polymerase sigma factor, partial [Gammaproteobacteria bacterium]|nr:sigma-70 family RNA polymerase sigma factor [Gammaproteobacteria bacterium]
DLVQETMLRAWRSLDSLRDEGSAKRWLITILRRERARYYERLRPDTVDIENVPLADERQLDAEDNAERDHIRRTMQMLDEDYREPLVLQVLMGYSVEEIADIMGLNKATVLTRLFRARKKLAGLLEDPVLQAEGI